MAVKTVSVCELMVPQSTEGNFWWLWRQYLQNRCFYRWPTSSAVL